MTAPTNEPPARRLRVGVAGLGIGQAHLLAYLSLPEHFEVVALADVDAERRTKAAGDWGVPTAVGSVEELAALDLDVVDICTPPWLHAEHVLAAIGSGRHVICEKPLAPSLADVDRIIAAADGSTGLVMPVFQYRYGAGAARLRALVDAGLTGRLHLATSETAWTRGPDYFEVPWRGRWATEGGGAVLSHATHAHDLVTWLGGPVRSVAALAATLVNDVETEDTAAAVVELDQGGRAPAIASLSVTLGSATEISRLRFCFEHVTAESSLEPYDPGAEPWSFHFADPGLEEEAQRIWSGIEDPGGGYVGQFRRFHAAVTAGEPLPVTLADARAAIELVTAWYDAARSGRRVSLPLGTDADGYEGLAPNA
jgi:predicted dehydrogenase